MVFRAVEGQVVSLGSVSGTDGTPIGLYEPTHAQRVFLENPFLVPNFEQTVINSTASGSGVQVVGGGIVNVSTAGQTITVSGPAFEEVEGPDVDSLNTLTGTLTLQGQNTVSISTADPNITISGAGIASLGPGPDGLVFINDPTRGNKRLSIDRQVVLYSEDGNSDGTYLRPGNVINNFAGWIIPRDGTITAATYGYITGAANKDFIIRINNSTDLNTTNVLSATATVDSGLNIDVSEGDVLQVFISATGAGIADAFATIEIAWRT
ncbi:MAG: hypothetical protein GF334_04700 [Candidatus Altiarchaeales archaeon]|nr:hypothetical protein [Candidatus Altiarchaeales archaeon]